MQIETYSRTIGEYQNNKNSHQGKKTKRIATPSTPIPSRRKAGSHKGEMLATFAVISCILLATNLYCNTPLTVTRGRNNGHTDDGAGSSNVSRPCRQVTLSPGASSLGANSIQVMLDAVRQFDFSLLPVAAAHIPLTKIRPPSTTTENQEVVSRRLNFACAQQREHLSWPQIWRQIGVTLENPITALAEESLTVHHLRTLRTECPSDEDLAKLAEITRRADRVVSMVITFLPGSQPWIVAQNIVGPLLQLLADDMEGRSIDLDRISEINDQILFLSKSVAAFSPTPHSDTTPRLPNNMHIANNKVMTQINGRTWQLSYREERFMASDNGEIHEVTYSPASKQWKFVDSSGHAPITGVLLEQVHALGPDGIRRSGGLDGIASHYRVDANALNAEIKGDARLTIQGWRRVEKVQTDRNAGHATAEDLYTAPQQDTVKSPDAAQGEALPEPSIKTAVIVSETSPKETQKHYGQSDSESRQPAPAGGDRRETLPGKEPGKKKLAKPIQVMQPKTRFSPRRRIGPKLLREIHKMGSTGIAAAGGIEQIAQQKKVPPGVLSRYITPEGSLTQIGRYLLHPPQKKITAKLLNNVAKMAPQDIKKQGGLSKFARIEGISITALRRYIRKDGSLTRRGKQLLDDAQREKAVRQEENSARESLAERNPAHLTGKNQPQETAQQQQRNVAPAPQIQEVRGLMESGSPRSESELEKVQPAAPPPPAVGPNAGIAPNPHILRLVLRRQDLTGGTALSAMVEGSFWDMVYNLEQDVFYLGYRDHDGEWQRSSGKAYIAQESTYQMTELPDGETRIVTDEQRTASLKALGCDLDLTTLDNWVENYQHYPEIPHRISSVWVGTKEIPEHLLETLDNNAYMAFSADKEYDFTLYLSRRSEAAYRKNLDALAVKAPFVKVITLEDSPFYQTFRQTKYYEQYNAAIEGNGGVATNFASAADALRFQLVKYQGGIYLDVDDILTLPPGELQLNAPPDGFLLSGPMSNDLLGMRDQYNTNIFGTHKDNPTLERMSEESYARYQANKDIYQSRPPLDDIAGFDRYAKRISYIAGPGMFDSVIKSTRYEENQVLEAHRLWQLPLDDDVIARMDTPLIKKIFKAVASDILKLEQIVQVGAEHSWRYSRR